MNTPATLVRMGWTRRGGLAERYPELKKPGVARLKSAGH